MFQLLMKSTQSSLDFQQFTYTIRSQWVWLLHYEIIYFGVLNHNEWSFTSNHSNTSDHLISMIWWVLLPFQVFAFIISSISKDQVHCIVQAQYRNYYGQSQQYQIISLLFYYWVPYESHSLLKHVWYNYLWCFHSSHHQNDVFYKLPLYNFLNQKLYILLNILLFQVMKVASICWQEYYISSLIKYHYI